MRRSSARIDSTTALRAARNACLVDLALGETSQEPEENRTSAKSREKRKGMKHRPFEKASGRVAFFRGPNILDFPVVVTVQVTHAAYESNTH